MLVVVDWVVGLDGEDEVGGDELGTLVEELVEGVLSIGGGFSKEDRASGVLDELIGAARNCLSVGLHGELLEISWEAVEVLVETVMLDQYCHYNQVKELTEKPSESGHHRNQSTTRSKDRQ